MRCRTCEYPLWRIRDRACPECGSPFKPSDYDFVINSVRFCCPRCDQAYYGTGPRGHLVPDSFTCVRCAALIEMDQTVLLPAEGVAEGQTEAEWMPWIDPRGRGRVRRLLLTIWKAMVEPHRLIRATPESSSAGRAFSFLFVATAATLFVAVLPCGLFMTVLGFMAAGAGGRGGAGVGVFAGMLLSIGGVLAVAFLIILVLATLWGLLAHGLLRITGPTAGGLSRTFHAIFYGSGANAATAVPIVGGYFGWIWWVVSSTLMLKEGQRVHGGRAALAGVLPPVTFVLAVIGAYVALILSVASFVPAPRPGSGGISAASTPGSPFGQSSLLAQAITTRARVHGEPPTHAIGLLIDGMIQPDDLAGATAGWSVNTPADIRVGVTALDRIPQLPVARERAVRDAAEAAITPTTVAYRFGDFVFTYPGIDVTDPNHKDLWVVVAWPDVPPAQVTTYASTTVGNFTKVGVSPAAFDADLAGQNQLRASLGMPPLPHPKDVPQGQAVDAAETPAAPPEP